LDEKPACLRKIDYIDYLEEKNYKKTLTLIKSKSENKNNNDFLNSRSLYYGLYFYYDFIGEKSNLSTVFEVLDNYFLKKFHENFHSFITTFDTNFLEKIPETNLTHHSLFHIICDSLENTYYLLFDLNPK